jgi:hypothetical protein
MIFPRIPEDRPAVRVGSKPLRFPPDFAEALGEPQFALRQLLAIRGGCKRDSKILQLPHLHRAGNGQISKRIEQHLDDGMQLDAL